MNESFASLPILLLQSTVYKRHILLHRLLDNTLNILTNIPHTNLNVHTKPPPNSLRITPVTMSNSYNGLYGTLSARSLDAKLFENVKRLVPTAFDEAAPTLVSARAVQDQDSGYETTDNEGLEPGELYISSLTAQKANEKASDTGRRIECTVEREEAVDDGKTTTLPKLFLKVTGLRQPVEDIAHSENRSRRREVANAQIKKKRKTGSDDEEEIAGPSEPKKAKTKLAPKPRPAQNPKPQTRTAPSSQAAPLEQPARRIGNRPGTRSTSTIDPSSQPTPALNPYVCSNEILYYPNPLQLPLPLSYLIQTQTQSTEPTHEEPKEAWTRLFPNEADMSSYIGPNNEGWRSRMWFNKDEIGMDGIKGAWVERGDGEEYVPQPLGRVGTKTRMERETKEKEREEAGCMAFRKGVWDEREEDVEADVEAEVARILEGMKSYLRAPAI
jgi:hypothetical protein